MWVMSMSSCLTRQLGVYRLALVADEEVDEHGDGGYKLYFHA